MTGLHTLDIVVLVAIGGVVFPFWVPNMVETLQIWPSIAPVMGIAFWLGLVGQ